MIFLVDIDAFFAQAEQVRDPSLRGRPVIVGGRTTDRSVVAAASYEARALGVKTAMPISQAVRICPQATFLRGNFDYYSHLSGLMREVCLSHTPLVEMVSMDECFMDVSGCRRRYKRLLGNDFGPDEAEVWPLAAARRLQEDIHRQTGLVVSIGVASNRTVAKISSDLAKPGGVLHVRRGYEAALLAPLPLGHLPGVGKRTAERLQRYNLKTIGQLAALGGDVLAPGPGGAVASSSAADDLQRSARGEGGTLVRAEAGLPKSISRETTFERDVTNLGRLRAMVNYLLQRAALQLRQQGLLTATVTIKLRYSDFQTVSRSRTLRQATDHDDVLYEVAQALLSAVWSRRVAVRLVGVCLSHLTAEGPQLQLYDQLQHDRRSRLYQSLDEVRGRFGFSSVIAGRAVELLESHRKDDRGFQLPVGCLSR